MKLGHRFRMAKTFGKKLLEIQLENASIIQKLLKFIVFDGEDRGCEKTQFFRML